MPDKYKKWNGIVFNSDIWLDKAMTLISEHKRKEHEKNPYGDDV